MSFDEKNTWAFGLVALVTYTVYVLVVLTRAGGGPLTEVAYVAPMLWSIGAAVVAGIVANVVISAGNPREAGRRDVRDREIDRFGEHVGQSFLVIGLIAVLVLAMLEVEHFWIANVVYLAFVLSALLGAMAKIAAYRGRFQPW